MKIADTHFVFHAEGDQVKGTGHVARALGLALDMQKVYSNLYISFYTNSRDICVKFMNAWNISSDIQVLFLSDDQQPPCNWEISSQQHLQSLLKSKKVAKSEVLITDGKYGWSEEEWTLIKKRFNYVIAIDNISSLNMPIDANIYPTAYFKMPEPNKIPKSKTLFGEDWVWLNGAIDKIQKHPSKTHDFSIFMGGADPTNLSLKALQDIVFKYQEVKKIIVITGPLYKYQKTLNVFIKNTKQQVTHMESENNYHLELLRANYTLIAFGLSSMELASLGQACILYSHNPEHQNDMDNYLTVTEGNTSTSRELWLQGVIPISSNIKARINVGKNIISLVESLS